MMQPWVRANIWFRDRVALLAVGGADAVRADLDRLLSNLPDEPEKVEPLVRALILRFRPALAGCVILAMAFDGPSWEWQFFVSHESFAPVPLGMPPPRVPLIPEQEAEPDHVVAG